MSSPRDRLGLLLPLPALLVVAPTSTHAQDSVAPASAAPPAAAPPSTAPPSTAPPGTAPPPSEAPPGSASSPEPPPTMVPTEEGLVRAEEPSDELITGTPLFEDDHLESAKASFMEGRQAFAEGDYLRAAVAFEESATHAPELVPLLIDATIAYRHAVLAEQDADRALSLCEDAKRSADAVSRHLRATPQEIELAVAELNQANDHCAMLEETTYGPCLSIMPCLSPPHGPRGCGGRRNEDFAMLGSVMLLGLRSRRRRDAVERLAARLPPDVATKLRQGRGDGGDDDG